MVKIASRISDEERKKRYKSLHLTAQEEQALLMYDKAVESNQITEFDLPSEKQKIAKKYTCTGTRKTPTIYQFTPRQRKPNATKGGIITELNNFIINNSQFSTQDVNIINKERQISFKIGENSFDLILIQNRKPK